MRRISHILQPVPLEMFINSLVITVVLITWSLVTMNVVKCSGVTWLNEIQFNISDNLAVGGIVGNLAGTEIAKKCKTGFDFLFSYIVRMDFTTLNIILEEQFWKKCHHIVNPYLCSKIETVACTNAFIASPIRINVNRAFNSSEYTLTMPENKLVGDEYPLDKYGRNPDPDGNYVYNYSLVCKNECYKDNSPTFGLRLTGEVLVPVLQLMKPLDRETIDKYTLELVPFYSGNNFLPSVAQNGKPRNK